MKKLGSEQFRSGNEVKKNRDLIQKSFKWKNQQKISSLSKDV